METETQEIQVGDRVFLRDRQKNLGSNWDGLRAVVVALSGTNVMVRMDEGDKRADGYDHEPFQWNEVEKRTDVEPDENERLLASFRDRIASLETALRESRVERSTAEETLDNFKQTVTQVAVKYAREYDWCSVVQSALEEMGLETTVEQRIRVSGYVTATVPICGEAGDLNVTIEIEGQSVSDYDLEVEFDTDSY